ncbi:SGNH/GDSL hydrolase family protein [Prescottella agglutinans]|uniref:SGNH/GDSL hydrolase family protein n=1 Tax=Prescottella agglutinans TaxID=1644129 RepID=A0A3S3BSL7_9NOCA|nr:SGNH/GDSL hydrolase family protein [Prescottella agglutinans]RVW08272.1 SGNH/GDSL hydrolase family protein [Prescottella agglutinans]
MTNPMLEKLIRFQRPEHTLPYARNLSVETLSGIFGTDEDQYRSVLEGFDVQRTEVAARLAADPRVSAHLETLPFERGARLVAIGESTTADRLSWFEILRTILETHRPDLELRFANLAVAGATSTQMLAAVPAIRRQTADWMFCMLGGNDSQRLGSADGPQLVTRQETLRNLTELRAQAFPDDSSRWIWVTPTPVDETLVAAFPFFRDAGISWTNADLSSLAAAILAMPGLAVDSTPAVSDRHGFTEDGLHLSIATQEALTARILGALSEGDAR